MFRRGVLLFLSILVTLGFFVSSRAAPVEQITVFPITVTVLQSANIRSGPGTEFDIIGSARAGQSIAVTGCNADCSWYQLAPDCWIAAFLVKAQEPVIPPVAPVSIQLPTGIVVIPTIAVPTIVVGIPITVPNTSTQTTQCPQTITEVNTYAGPGTFYAVVDTRPAGECVAVVGRNFIGDWLQLSHGMWIAVPAVLFVEPINLLPITDRVFTATPIPTPTPSPTPSLSVEEQEYIAFIERQNASYESSWAEVQRLITLAQQTPSLILTDEWKTQMNAALTFITVTNQNIRTRFPPLRMVDAHAQFVSATNSYEQAVIQINIAIAGNDVNQLAAVQAFILEGNAFILSGFTFLDLLSLNPIAPLPTATPVSVGETATPVLIVVTATPTPQPATYNVK